MIEIRPLRAGRDERAERERDDFLRVLCGGFDLDPDLAKPLFTADPMYDDARSWALFEAGRVVSCLTTRPLEFGWGRAIGIAGVATREEARGEGYARRLLERVLRESERAGEGPALLFAQDLRLYESLGFEPLDRVARFSIRPTGAMPPMEEPSFESVRARYDAWASRSPERLRRDDRRWGYWRWKFRNLYRAGEGYYAIENDHVREVLAPGAESGLPVRRDTEALFLSYVVDKLELPFEPIQVELYLMGRGVPGLVQMFLTDQF